MTGSVQGDKNKYTESHVPGLPVRASRLIRIVCPHGHGRQRLNLHAVTEGMVEGRRAACDMGRGNSRQETVMCPLQETTMLTDRQPYPQPGAARRGAQEASLFISMLKSVSFLSGLLEGSALLNGNY